MLVSGSSKSWAEKICILSDGNWIAEHKRSWQTTKWIMDIYHYLKPFKRKKRLAESECFSQAPEKKLKKYTQNII